MAPTTLGNNLFGRVTPNTNHSIKLFDIRLDENPLVLRGSRDSASGVLLKGALVLCLAEPLRSVQSIQLRFTGRKRVDFVQVNGQNAGYHKAEVGDREYSIIFLLLLAYCRYVFELPISRRSIC